MTYFQCSSIVSLHTCLKALTKLCPAGNKVCHPNPCLNGGICTPSTAPGIRFECKCSLQYSGQRCEGTWSNLALLWKGGGVVCEPSCVSLWSGRNGGKGWNKRNRFPPNLFKLSKIRIIFFFRGAWGGWLVNLLFSFILLKYTGKLTRKPMVN